MYINEIERNSVITINAGVEGSDKTLTFITKAIEPYGEITDHAILAQAIRYNNRLLNFNNCIATAEVLAQNRPHKFEVESIENIQVDGEVCCLIKSATDAKPINRRGAFRYQMIGDAVIKISTNAKPYQCFTHDLSATGISFLVEEPIVVDENMEILAVFESNGLRCNVRSYVKRTEYDEEKNMTLIGCEIDGNTQLIEQLVAVLMRKQAKKYRK